MLRIMTDEEVKAGNERRAFLHASPFTIDNLTAVLMDSSTGDLGLYEVQARAKAHGILNYLRVITGADIPERRDGSQDIWTDAQRHAKTDSGVWK